MRPSRVLGIALLATILTPLASADVIISNFSAAVGVGTAFGGGASTVYKAFGFTMGAQSQGLESVVLSMDFTTANPVPVISIWDDAGGAPGVELIVLDNPAILSGVADYEFTPPTSFTLQANTAYWVHVRSEPTSGPTFYWDGSSPSTLPSGSYATAIGYIFNGSSSSYYNRLEVRSGGEPGEAYCPGDGIAPHTACPCVNNNNGSMGGCDWGNPAFPEGGVLTATGSDSMAANDTYLVANSIEDNFGIFFGAANQVNGGNGNPLNDGLRCAGGSLVRLIPPTMASGNTATIPQPLQTLDTGAAGGVTRRYQYWFRTPTGPCGQMANLTNGYEIVWVP